MDYYFVKVDETGKFMIPKPLQTKYPWLSGGKKVELIGRVDGKIMIRPFRAKSFDKT